MIQKISTLTNVVKPSVRSLLKNCNSKLKTLSGSSMSGWDPPIFHDTEMVIPGGLTFPEKAFYLLKGKLPKSVYERWFPNDGEHVINAGDQLVTVQRTYEGYVGHIVEPPHDLSGAAIDAPDGGYANDISGSDTIAGGSTDVDDDGGIGVFEAFKHLAGLQ